MSILPALLLLLGQPAPSHEALMDEIERAIRLPDEADLLDAYGRYYAFSAPGVVHAIYRRRGPRPTPTAPDECSVMTEDDDLKPCTAAEIAEMDKRALAFFDLLLAPGERRWFDTEDDFPFINDGGCVQVNVEYVIASQTFTYVGCNGTA